MNEKIDEIWKDLHQELKNFILSKVRNIDTSEDILQDVFLKIHLNIHTLADCSKLTSWVYQITRNVITDYYRKTSPEIQVDGFDFAEQESEEPIYLALSNCINKKISLLPENYKQAILFTYFENYSQVRLSEELNVSYSGAKSRVQRGREKLKELVIDCQNVVTDAQGNFTAYDGSQI